MEELVKMKRTSRSSVADPDPKLFLTPGSVMEKVPDPG